MSTAFNRTGFLHRIRQAFHGVLPPERTLFVAEAMDSFSAPVQPDFTGPWEEIPYSHLEACPNALAYLDADGMKYYLPAFMCWCLHLASGRKPMAFYHTLYSMDPNIYDYRMHTHFLSRFSTFTPEQLSVVAEYIKACADNLIPEADSEAAQHYWDAYWHQYSTA